MDDNIQSKADLNDDQQKAIDTFKTTLLSLGYCVNCMTIPIHHIDEPFSSCKCGTGEDYAKYPLQEFQIIKQKLEAQLRERDKRIESLLDFAKQVKKQLTKNGEYAPLSHIWVDCVISGKDVDEEVRNMRKPTI